MSTPPTNTNIDDIYHSSPPGPGLKPASSQSPKPRAVDVLTNCEAKGPQSLVQERAGGIVSDSTDLVTKSEAIFLGDDANSPFNPRGEKFNARMWTKAIAETTIGQGHDFRRIGLCFQKLNVFGYGTANDFQKDVGNIWLALPSLARSLFSVRADKTRIDILREFDGIIRPGDMCVVLGPPGSGCSTFLKAIAGETNGIYINEASYFNYQGISAEELHSAHRGDAIYTAEVDVHFPQLTVGETLTFASRARCQREIPHGISRNQYVFSVFYKCYSSNRH